MATYCICKKADAEGVLWISCDKCKGWFHPSCVDLDEDEIDPDGDWFCPLCISSGVRLQPVTQSSNVMEQRRCGRAKCGKFAQGRDSFCIDCKLVQIERSSNKLKRTRVEDKHKVWEPSPKRQEGFDHKRPLSPRTLVPSKSSSKPSSSSASKQNISSKHELTSPTKRKIKVIVSEPKKIPQTLVHSPPSPKVTLGSPAPMDISQLLFNTSSTHTTTPHPPISPRLKPESTLKRPATDALSDGRSSPKDTTAQQPFKKREVDSSTPSSSRPTTPSIREENATSHPPITPTSSACNKHIPLKKRILSSAYQTESAGHEVPPTLPSPPLNISSEITTSLELVKAAPARVSHLERLEALEALSSLPEPTTDEAAKPSRPHVSIASTLSRGDHTTDISPMYSPSRTPSSSTLGCSSSIFTLNSNPSSTAALSFLVSAATMN